MAEQKQIFDLFDHDENFKFIMKRMLEKSMEESFNSIMITEAKKGYPIVYVNPAFCELTGYGPHEVMGKSPSILQGSETDEKVLKQLDEDIEAGRLFHGRAINYRRDRSKFMMEWKIVPISNDQDEVTHYLAIQKDVTEGIEPSAVMGE